MQSKYQSVMFILATILLLIMAQVQSTASPVATSTTITVNAKDILGPVNRKVLGFNILAANRWIIKGVKWKDFSPRRFGYIRTGGGVWNPKTMKPNPQVLKLVKPLRPGVLRYPGGNLVHGYNWKDAVGPVKTRGQWRFGIDQYIEYCRDVGAQPQFVMNEYSSSPQAAAQLVEYLNSPATPDHPWAMKRAKWGHPKPYNVKYFEYGNETSQGNQRMTPPKQYSGAQYAAHFLAAAKAMRAVDPSIKLGMVLSPQHPQWAIVALKDAGKEADFVIVHVYPVNYRSNTPHPDISRAMRACLAADQQETYNKLKAAHQMIRKYVGHDLPLAITEYNAAFIQQKPKPFRYSYGPALFSADFARIMLKPSSDILLADYFELINGYWGMIHKPGGDLSRIWKGRGGYRRMAAYPLYKLWAQHLGDQVTALQVTCPHIAFEGFAKTAPARGDRYQPPTKINSQNLATIAQLQQLKKKSYTIQRRSNHLLAITLHGLTGRRYPRLKTITLAKKFRRPKGGSIHLSFEAKYTPAPGSGSVQIGLGLMDARGWKATGSAVGAMYSGSKWRKVETTLNLLPDAKGVILLVRLQATDQPVSGTYLIRNLHVDVISQQVFPAYPAQTAFSSISADGKTLYLMVFNKSTKKKLNTTIDLKGFAAKSARYWQVTGPSLAANNIKKMNIKISTKDKPLALSNSHELHYTFPPISMTAIELYR